MISTHRALLGVLVTHLVLLGVLVAFRKTSRLSASRALAPSVSMPSFRSRMLIVDATNMVYDSRYVMMRNPNRRMCSMKRRSIISAAEVAISRARGCRERYGRQRRMMVAW